MHDSWFFLGVFVFIFLIWIATGGPVHQLAFTGPKLALPGALGGGTYLSLPRAPLGVGNTDISLPGSSSNGSTSNNSETAVPTFAGDSTFGTPSPYRNIVRMNHYVSGAGSSDSRNEYVEVSVSQDAGVPVDLSGWRVVSSATGSAVSIPKGTEIPISGTINADEDIVLSPGTRALLISGQSPIGASFRENKCIGYFSTFQKFYPPLPQNCPVPSDDLSSFYGTGYIGDAACIDYVNKLSRCQVALTPPASASGSCQRFIVKYLNYNGCVDAHKTDADFMGNTWRIYLGRSSSLWRTQHEIVKLLDVNGKTVDAFSY